MNTLSPSQFRFPLTGELHSIGPGNGTVLWFPIPFTALESSIQTRPWGGDEAADTRVWTFADHATDLFLQGAESLDDIEPCGMLKGFEGWRRGRVCNAFRRRALLMRPAASSSSTERFAGERAARLACLADPRCVGIQYHHADGTYHIIHPSQCCTTRAAPVEDDGSTSGILVKTGYGGCVDDNCRECGFLFEHAAESRTVLPRTAQFIEGKYFTYLGDGCCGAPHLNTLANWDRVEHFDSRQDVRWKRSWHYDVEPPARARRLQEPQEETWGAPEKECREECRANQDCGAFVVTSSSSTCPLDSNSVLEVAGVQFGAEKCEPRTRSSCVLKGLLPVTSTHCASWATHPARDT